MPTQGLPDHLVRPHLRMLQPVPVNKDGKQFVALRDPSMLSPQTMIVPAPALQVLMQFQGERTVEEVAAQFKSPPGQLEELVRELDRLGLLWGPTFEAMERKVKEDLAERGSIPPGASAALGETAEDCRRQIDEWIEQTEDPEIEEAVAGIVAPHLDYARGWPNYAAAYRCLDATEPPDRVVILGTNHYGIGDGAVLCEYAFESPLGSCPADTPTIGRLVERLGEAAIVDQLDHLREHSVQLQLPWIQHRYGDVPVVAALVPDPSGEMISDDGERIDHDAFVNALTDVLAAADGRTLVVASADLSHVGPQFGEPRAVDDQRRLDVERHDREMMGRFVSGDIEDFLSAMSWSKNPTRWCSVGNMAAAARVTSPSAIELVDYRQACDEKGACMVTSAAMALLQ